MNSRTISDMEEKEYKSVIERASLITADHCNDEDLAAAAGKAYFEISDYYNSLEWYTRYFHLNRSDEALGMALYAAFSLDALDVASHLMDSADDLEGYYYLAGRFELAFRSKFSNDSIIAALESFLDLYDEESYMLKLAELYLLEGKTKEATRVCKKIVRLFNNGKAVDHAKNLLDEIRKDNGVCFAQEHKWKDDGIFVNLPFELTSDNNSDTLSRNKRNDADITIKLNTTFDEVHEENKETQEITANKGRKSDIEKEQLKVSSIIDDCMRDIVGMQELKIELNTIINMLQSSIERTDSNLVLRSNLIIAGPDGCGKTTAAKIAVKVLNTIGLIESNNAVVVDKDSIAGKNAEESYKNIEALYKIASGGCIVIDNIHEFSDSSSYGKGIDAINQFVKADKATNGKIPIIITGRSSDLESILNNNWKFSSLFNLPTVTLGKYSVDELIKIANLIAARKGLYFDNEAANILSAYLAKLYKQPDFKYSRDIEKIINNAYIHQVNRISEKQKKSEEDYFVLTAEDMKQSENVESVEELLNELNNLIGLSEVKKQVNKIVNYMAVQRMREESGLSFLDGPGSLHLAFMGNAGTGKTTVARIIGKIYKRMGVLPKGQLVECTRRDLVSEYVGGTAKQVEAKINEAIGGILFVDEAYSLCRNEHDTVGREAIETLLADIENHRDNLMVILAGYSVEMNRFMDQNQGLRSRIPTDIYFEDYTVEELVKIFRKIIRDKGFYLDLGLDNAIYKLINKNYKKRDFGNARGVRNLVEQVVLKQSSRLGTMSPDEISKRDFLIIKAEDLELEDKNEISTKAVNKYIKELNSLTGLSSVKDKVNAIVSTVQVNKKMEEAGLAPVGHGTLHLVFKGNAGTGKTTVARIIGNIYRELGVLSTGQLIETDRSGLVGQYVGETAQKTKRKIQEAMGGVLFIDEAYSLSSGGNDFGKEAIDTLVADMENYRDDLMVIVAGYSDDMDKFLDENQGLRSRLSNELIFEDYSISEMLTIFKSMVASRNLEISETLDAELTRIIEIKSSKKDFGNARGVRNLLDEICEKRNIRLSMLLAKGKDLSPEQMKRIESEDIYVKGIEKREEKTIDQLMEELNNLIGLESAKDKVNKIISTVQVNNALSASGLDPQGFGTLHMVFKGNAGTGKTTVARIIGNIYRELGVLSTGQLIETDRSGLVGQYVGETAQKTKRKIQEAMGGVLFIDEAYSLAKGGETDFGKEAIDTLVADMENHRDDLMVIIAGYGEEMESFLSQNQGLRSRFSNEIVFEDYDIDELFEIFKVGCEKRHIIVSSSLDANVRDVIIKAAATKDFGNARGVRNLIDKLLEQRNLRIAAELSNGKHFTPEELNTVIREDIDQML